jgi:trk system potassium uptake protein TrkA
MSLLQIFNASAPENKQFAVIGLGRFGRSVCQTLTKFGCEVMGIDKDGELVAQATVDKLASHCLQLDSTKAHALKEAGVTEFHTVVVAIGNYIEESIITTLNLKEGGAKYVVAKASSEVHRTLLKKVGADKVVFPEQQMGISLAWELTTGGIIEKLELNTEYSEGGVFIRLNTEYSIAGVFVPHEFHNKSILELNLRQTYGINVLWISNGKDKFDISPDPKVKLKEGTIIGVMGKNEDIDRLSHNSRRLELPKSRPV